MLQPWLCLWLSLYYAEYRNRTDCGKRDSAFYNGTTSDRAAASCWEAKQANPEAKSGAYWLYTPLMSQPAQFYCDQETDGGGWVKIGEGRDGWTENYEGQGDASQLYSDAAPASSGLTLEQGKALSSPTRRKDPDSAFQVPLFLSCSTVYARIRCLMATVSVAL